MKVEASDIDREALKALLVAQYNLAVHSLQFWPQGEESYGYIANTQDQKHYFAKLYDDDLWCPPDLETTMATTFRLHHFVLIILLTSSGALLASRPYFNLFACV